LRFLIYGGLRFLIGDGKKGSFLREGNSYAARRNPATENVESGQKAMAAASAPKTSDYGNYNDEKR
jgi:hypothetical protein